MEQRIVILGRPGVGKTTLIKQVIERFPRLFQGFYTEEIREGGSRTGFRIVTLSGKIGILASKRGISSFQVGAYHVFVADLEHLVIPELEHALQQGVPILIDEIGKMELFSQRFRELLEPLWRETKLLLATSRFPEIPEIKKLFEMPGTLRFLLSPGNRRDVLATVSERIACFRREEQHDSSPPGPSTNERVK